MPNLSWTLGLEPWMYFHKILNLVEKTLSKQSHNCFFACLFVFLVAEGNCKILWWYKGICFIFFLNIRFLGAKCQLSGPLTFAAVFNPATCGSMTIWTSSGLWGQGMPFQLRLEGWEGMSSWREWREYFREKEQFLTLLQFSQVWPGSSAQVHVARSVRAKVQG